MPRLRDKLSAALGRTPQAAPAADYLTLQPSPRTLVDRETGRYIPGWYETFDGVANVSDSSAPKGAFQTWYHLQIDHPERFIVLNLANVALASNVAILLYEKKTDTFEHVSLVRPFRAGLVSLSADLSRIEDSATGSWIQRKGDRVFFSLRAGHLRSEGEAQMAIGPEFVQVTGFHAGRGSFQRYGNLILTRGTLSIGDRTHVLEPGLPIASDQTAGHQRGLQHWHWLCTSGYAKNERTGERVPFGMQLSKDRERAVPRAVGHKYLLWLGGKLHKFANAEIDYRILSDKTRDTGPWTVRMWRDNPELSADIAIVPRAHRREKKSAILMDADFNQHYGELTGTVVVAGDRYVLEPSFTTLEDSRLEL